MSAPVRQCAGCGRRRPPPEEEASEEESQELEPVAVVEEETVPVAEGSVDEDAS